MTAAAEDLLGSLPAFDASLEHVASFPAYVWLAPAPRDRFLGLIRHVYGRFPEYPPYAGEHAEPEPHLTVGEVDTGMDVERLVGAAERELAPGLPLRFRVGRVTLLGEAADGTWSGLRTFDLG